MSIVKCGGIPLGISLHADAKPFADFLAERQVVDVADPHATLRRRSNTLSTEPSRVTGQTPVLLSLLLASGAPLTYVAAQLGHRRATTTLRYYARWLPKEGRRYVDALDNQRREQLARSGGEVMQLWNQRESATKHCHQVAGLLSGDL